MPSALSPLSSRAARVAAVLALGVLTACGSDTASTIAAPAAPSLARSGQANVLRASRYPLVFATNDRGCSLLKDGLTRCWGWNVEGEVGDGTTAQRLSPTVVAGGLSFVDLGLGIYHTCGLTTAGKAYCWGQNIAGELGDGTTTDRYTPTAVMGNDAFVQIAGGYWHTCGITTAGETKCWGEFNTAPTGPQLVPGFKFQSLSHGNNHVCGVTRAGEAYCWHSLNASYGQIGDGQNVYRPTPTQVIGGIDFASVDAGGAHTCGLDGHGRAYCWGYNNIGQIGDGTMNTDRWEPTPVNTALRFTEIHAGNSHTCALVRQGDAYCWGNGWALGNGTGLESLTPAPVVGGIKFRSLAANGTSTCGVSRDDEVYCWGWNYNGGVGVGTTTYYELSPRLVVP